MEEQEAVERLKRGDIGGLEALVRAHQVRAVRTATLITQDRALAEDIVQTAFLRAYERIGQFDAGRPFGPWFTRSVVNDAIKAARRRGRQVPLEHGLTLADPTPGPAAQAESADVRDAVQAALVQLPPGQWAAIVLRYYLDYSEADMADALNVPPGTIKWRLHQARKKLKTLLGDTWAARVEQD